MRASAYVINPAERAGSALMGVARGLGFEAVLPYAGAPAAEQQAYRTPLMFFLCPAGSELERLKPFADDIRFFPNPQVRFSPMICFAEHPSLADIRRCIDMGFDDIITLPFTRERVLERLLRQVDHLQVYYETASYFGPDRRGRPGSEENHARRGTGGRYRRVEITRNQMHGITVVSDDMHVVV
jgi:hypothetical protein